MAVRLGRARFVPASAAPSVQAPTGPFSVGSEVGVPTGTSLTSTSGLPAADATETLTLTHPLTGATVDRTVSVWRRRRWATTMVATPPSGATYLFDECEFSVTSDNWTAEIVDTNATLDLMAPQAVFRRCTFDGNSSCGRSLLASFVWVIDCHVADSEDAWGGAAYSVATGTNFVAGDDGQFDPHADGVQNAGLGHTVLYHCWCSAGVEAGASQAVRFGTEFSAVENVRVYYCGLDRGGWTLQFRGDAGAGAGITDVHVVGCRWTPTSGFGPKDFEETTGVTWTDNALMDGTPITYP